MNEACMIVKCERCGNESRLPMRSVRSSSFLCPVCMENEVECRLAIPEIQIYYEPGNIIHNLYPYVTDPVGVSTN